MGEGSEGGVTGVVRRRRCDGGVCDAGGVAKTGYGLPVAGRDGLVKRDLISVISADRKMARRCEDPPWLLPLTSFPIFRPQLFPACQWCVYNTFIFFPSLTP